MNNNQSGVPTIHIPAGSVAVVGREWNLYFDSVIICDNLENYDVRCSISPALTEWGNYGELLRIMPTAAGVHTVTLSIYNKFNNEEITSKSFVLNVIEEKPVNGKKVVFIGDSLTAAGYYGAEIQFNLSKGGIRSIGTQMAQVTLDNKPFVLWNEGRPGWATCHYHMEIADYTLNPFYNPETGKFDFSYYMEKHMKPQGEDHVDAVSIFLGTNGVKNEKNLDNVKAMVQSVRDYDPNVIVLVNLLQMPATQTGYGYLGMASSAYENKFAAMMLNDKYVEAFDGVMDNVYVSELNFNFDSKRDYATTTIPASARRKTTGITVQTNNVHPDPMGYMKFADTIYANLLYHFTK